MIARYAPGVGMQLIFHGQTVLLPHHMSVMAIQKHVAELVDLYLANAADVYTVDVHTQRPDVKVRAGS